MRELRGVLAAATALLALVVPSALAETPAPAQPASQTAAPAPAPVQQGTSIAAPPAPAKPKPSGGTSVGSAEKDPEPETSPGAGAVPAPSPTSPTPSFVLPSVPTATCAPTDVPPVLIPIYQRASAAYGLGPQGPSVLAAINRIETAFGTNLNISSAGAMGWMQFMPPTWDAYGVDANGDGVRDPYNPEDAIHSAANYLSASGMPTDTPGAIFAYNHADWYVADVLSNAACYGSLGGAVADAFALTPKQRVLSCNPAKPWRKKVPVEYMNAFESAAARYDLGRRGVWALAAVARLESNFGRGMTVGELRRAGPLGLDGMEWRRYSVDGDGDGRMRHADPDDAAATLARLIWSRGDLRAGVFTHNQASWYVEAVMADAERLKGACKVRLVDWELALPNAVMAPIKWDNLTLSNTLEKQDLNTGSIDPRIVGLLGAITQNHQITISALRSDHSQFTVEGNVSNHYFGRAMDIATVDGVSCTDTSDTAPCAELGRILAFLPEPARPSELIYCFDLDGPGPAFARTDHCDHIHAGYDG
jgi:Transglycosylase SLT domain